MIKRNNEAYFTERSQLGLIGCFKIYNSQALSPYAKTILSEMPETS